MNRHAMRQLLLRFNICLTAVIVASLLVSPLWPVVITRAAEIANDDAKNASIANRSGSSSSSQVGQESLNGRTSKAPVSHPPLFANQLSGTTPNKVTQTQTCTYTDNLSYGLGPQTLFPSSAYPIDPWGWKKGGSYSPTGGITGD